MDCGKKKVTKNQISYKNLIVEFERFKSYVQVGFFYFSKSQGAKNRKVSI